ncbi:MAG: fibronectin type III domain-containing protein, partial [Thermoplasmata archaeon]
MKVTALKGNTLLAYDISDSNFNIFIQNPSPPSITLLWPNSPAINIEEKKSYYIKFYGSAEVGIKKVTAFFSPDGGNSWIDSLKRPYLFPYPTQKRDSILWEVTQAPTIQGRIKVLLKDAANQTAEDTSNYDFTIRPATPTNLQYNIDESIIYLSWKDNSNYEDSYFLEWNKNNSGWNVIQLPNNSTRDTFYGEPFCNYNFRVRCKKGDIYSYYSNMISVSTPLNNPTDLTLSTQSPYNSVYLSFKDNSRCEEKYIIKRKDLINGEKIFIIPGDTTKDIEYFPDNIFPFRDYEYSVYGAYSSYTTDTLKDTITCTPSFPGTISEPPALYCLSDGSYTRKIQRASDGTIFFIHKIKTQTEEKIVLEKSSDGGFNWQSEILFTSQNFELHSISLHLTSENIPVLIFAERKLSVPSKARLWYMFKTGNIWHTSLLDSIYSSHYGVDIVTPFAFIQNNIVHIGYGKGRDRGIVYDTLYYSKFLYNNPSQFSNNKIKVDVFTSSQQSRCVLNKGSFYIYKDTLNLVVEYNQIDGIMNHYKFKNNNWEKISEFYGCGNPFLFSLRNNLLLLTNYYSPSGLLLFQWTPPSWEEVWWIYFSGIINSACADNNAVYAFVDFLDKGYLIRIYPTYDGYTHNKILISNYGNEKDFQGIVWGISPIYGIEFAFVNVREKNNPVVIFKKGKRMFFPPPVATIDEGIPISDIPSNNSKRLFIKNDTLHILYSKNSLIYDAILKDSLIKKIFLGYGKNPAGFLYKNNLYSIWAYNDTTTLEKIEFTKIEENPSPTLAYTSSNTYLWGVGAP